LPAFIGLVAEPLIAIVDASYVGKLGAVYQAGMGIAISAQYSVAKLYNDPLLKTSTSLVAGKKGEELSASVVRAHSPTHSLTYSLTHPSRQQPYQRRYLLVFFSFYYTDFMLVQS
jgi:hypothetical protein